MGKARLILSLVTLGIQITYYGVCYITEAVTKKRAKKEAKLREMDAEAIDVEWRVVEEF